MPKPLTVWITINWKILKEMGIPDHLTRSEGLRIDAFELWYWRRLLTVPWTARIQPVHPKGDQFWVFIGRTDVEAETPIPWPPDVKS